MGSARFAPARAFFWGSGLMLIGLIGGALIFGVLVCVFRAGVRTGREQADKRVGEILTEHRCELERWG
jgi:hypothetical protein